MKRLLLLGDSLYKSFLMDLNNYAGKNLYDVATIYPYKINSQLLESIANKNFSLIMFTGGADVDPKYYNKEKELFTVCEPNRDALEKSVYDIALDTNTPMVGICRGAQFLTAMQENGSLIQHVVGHTTSHLTEIDPEYLPPGINNNILDFTSTHHQMMNLSKMDEDSYVVIAKVSEEAIEQQFGAHSNIYKMFDAEYRLTNITFDMPEIVHYINTNCLAIQGHPEFSYANPYNNKGGFTKLSHYLIANLLLKDNLNFQGKSIKEKLEKKVHFVEADVLEEPLQREGRRVQTNINILGQVHAIDERVPPDAPRFTTFGLEDEDGTMYVIPIDRNIPSLTYERRAYYNSFPPDEGINRLINQDVMGIIYRKISLNLAPLVNAHLTSIITTIYYKILFEEGLYRGVRINNPDNPGDIENLEFPIPRNVALLKSLYVLSRTAEERSEVLEAMSWHATVTNEYP